MALPFSVKGRRLGILILGMINWDVLSWATAAATGSSSSSPDARAWLEISSVMEMSSSGLSDWLDMDLGLLGREEGPSGEPRPSGVSGREREMSEDGGWSSCRSSGRWVDLRLGDAEGAASSSSRSPAREPSRSDSRPESTREALPMVSSRLWTPYMLSLGPSVSALQESSRSESRARKKVAGAALRGSDQGGTGCSAAEDLRERGGRTSGTADRMAGRGDEGDYEDGGAENMGGG